MRVVRDDLWLCVACMFAAVNGDADPEATEEEARATDEGLVRLGLYLVPDFDDGVGELESSWRECDCCGSSLGGRRYRFAILGEDEES